MKLWNQLVKEYDAIKKKIQSHANKKDGVLPASKIMKHMTQRSMAGLYLKISGYNALNVFDEICIQTPTYLEQWKTTRELIEQAIKEAKEQSEN